MQTGSTSILTPVVVFLLVLFFFGLQERGQATTFTDGIGDASRVIMYSLTTCGYCKRKVKELRNNNINFTEYFIDVDSARRDELHEKLDRSGYTPSTYGTPILEVYGVMLPNNPSLDTIREQLNKYLPPPDPSQPLGEYKG